MLTSEAQWFRQGPASDLALEKLKLAVVDPLPQEYLDLLSYSNGGEGPLPVQPYNLCLDSAEVTAESWQTGAYKEFFPGFLVFGSNGGGEYIAFDQRQGSPWPVVALDMTNIDLSETVMPIAESFASFVGLIGVEARNA
jgi:SMI1/KNR4 family protein SUKH-1